jgi:hypothetical protein
MTGQIAQARVQEVRTRRQGTGRGLTADAQEIEDHPGIESDPYYAELDANLYKGVVKVKLGLVKIADALLQIGLHLSGAPPPERLSAKHIPARAVHGHAKLDWAALLQPVGYRFVNVLKRERAKRAEGGGQHKIETGAADAETGRRMKDFSPERNRTAIMLR